MGIDIPKLAAELCHQHEVSELGGTWNQSRVEELIRRYVDQSPNYDRMLEAIRNVQRNTYLDDNVIKRHPWMSVPSDALKELFASISTEPESPSHAR